MFFRTDTGKVYRLYSRDAYEALTPDTAPEIQRTSLIGTVLDLKRLGINDILGFEFIDPPERKSVMVAIRDLYLLGISFLFLDYRIRFVQNKKKKDEV